MQVYRKNVQALGVEIISGEIISLLTERDRITGVRLADGTVYSSPIVINCSGAWEAAFVFCTYAHCQIRC